MSDAPGRTERKRQRRQERGQARAQAAATVAAAGPRYPLLLLGIAIAGAALSLWLAIVHASLAELPFCGVGSGCDIVQSSRWAELLGIPLAVLGIGMYGVLGACAWRLRRHADAWPLAWLTAFLGTVASLYYQVAVQIDLDAYCAWCLASLALIVAALVAATLARPAALSDWRWGRWLAGCGAGALLLAGALQLHYSGVLEPRDGRGEPYLEALAQHLTRSGAQFYGAYWCPHCQDQKRLFGAAAERLPYIECNPRSRGQLAPQCSRAGITGFPTWIIDGRRYPQTLRPAQLARYSAFRWDGPIPESVRD